MSDQDNLVKLREGLPGIPEELLLAQAQHEVVFLCGAGISIPSGVPDFHKLVKDVYNEIDPVIYELIKDDCRLPNKDDLNSLLGQGKLDSRQCAEIKRFMQKDYATVLDFLENRIDLGSKQDVRRSVKDIITSSGRKPNELHSSLVQLASRGTSRPILTTNYDLLLESANKKITPQIQLKSYNFKTAPRPSTNNPSFSGVFHLHGVLPNNENDHIDIILTQKDFSEYYLQRNLIPYFMQRVCRLFHLVLVGYRADELLMRNLMSAISEEKLHESSIKKIYVFHGSDEDSNQNTIEVADWKLRGFTPIEYNKYSKEDSKEDHSQLVELLKEWADISAPTNTDLVSRSKERIKEIVELSGASEEKCELFDHLYRRSSDNERTEIVRELRSINANPIWLDRIIRISCSSQITTTEQENQLIHQIRNFWWNRIEEPQALVWAMGAIQELKHRPFIQKAISDLLDIFLNKITPEWLRAWRLLLEGPWMHNSSGFHSDRSDYDILCRLASEDYSCNTIRIIADFVQPFFYLSTPKYDLSNDEFFPYEFLKNHIRIQGGHPSDDEYILQIHKIKDSIFLDQLALLLQKSIDQDVRVLSQNEEANDGAFCKQYVRLIYDPGIYDQNAQNPNIFYTGLSAAVNVLHCSVAKLCEIDKKSAMNYLCRWRNSSSPIYLRLWAAIAAYHDLIDNQEIFSFIMNLEHQFENTYNYPEIAELRAKRFPTLEKEMQEKIISRMLKVIDQNAESEQQRRWLAQELQRIVLYEGSLTGEADEQLKNLMQDFSYIKHMNEHQGLPRSEGALTSESSTIADYNSPFTRALCELTGVDRLNQLQNALNGNGQHRWHDVRFASYWIENNPKELLTDLKSTESRDYPLIWEKWGWHHKPLPETDIDVSKQEALLILDLIKDLPNHTISKAITGLCHWLYTWRKVLKSMEDQRPTIETIWHSFWPLATKETNRQRQESEKLHNRNSQDDHKNVSEVRSVDSLNNPVAYLMGVFLCLCPRINDAESEGVFSDDGYLRKMRDICIDTTDYSGLVVRWHFIEQLHYFSSVDQEWANNHLISILQGDSEDNLSIYRAVKWAFHNMSRCELLKQIGSSILNKPVDLRLNKEDRKFLACMIICGEFDMAKNGEQAIFKKPEITTMLRRIDDDIFMSIAGYMSRYVAHDFSRDTDNDAPLKLAGIQFRKIIQPFFENIWPKDRSISLKSPKLSEKLAKLPVASGTAFAEAVNMIKDYLTPFDCYRLDCYGLFDYDHTSRDLQSQIKSIIQNQEQAQALLELLHLTISDHRIPHDLSYALEVIKEKGSSQTSNSPEFIRLSALARRI